MSLTQLLACSFDSGVVLSLCGNKIAASPKHRLTDHLSTLVASHRDELIEHLLDVWPSCWKAVVMLQTRSCH